MIEIKNYRSCTKISYQVLYGNIVSDERERKKKEGGKKRKEATETNQISKNRDFGSINSNSITVYTLKHSSFSENDVADQ